MCSDFLNCDFMYGVEVKIVSALIQVGILGAHNEAANKTAIGSFLVLQHILLNIKKKCGLHSRSSIYH